VDWGCPSELNNASIYIVIRSFKSLWVDAFKFEADSCTHKCSTLALLDVVRGILAIGGSNGER
jgi:hypothetical protein